MQMASPPDLRAFRDALGCFATGVTIVTTRAPDGAPVGFTANSFSSVSLDPPLVLFSLHRQALSLAAFQAAPGFAINVLREDQGALSTRFASPAGDKWGDIAHRSGESGSPLLEEALARFDCVRHAVHEGGDHLIFVGRVLRFEAREGRPLLFCRGRYGALGQTETARHEEIYGLMFAPEG